MTREQAIDKANKVATELGLNMCVVWYPGKYIVAQLGVALELVATDALEETRIIYRTD